MVFVIIIKEKLCEINYQILWSVIGDLYNKAHFKGCIFRMEEEEDSICKSLVQHCTGYACGCV